MFKIILITLVILSASIKAAEGEADTGLLKNNSNEVSAIQSQVDLAAPAIDLAVVSGNKSFVPKTSAGYDTKKVNNLHVAPTQARVAARTGFNAQLSASSTSPNSSNKCHNRFDTTGFQVAQDCTRCLHGTHENNTKCVSNLDGCSSKTLTLGSCKSCKFWYWTSKSTVQGNYCYNRWWMWVIIFSGAFMGLILLVSIIGMFTCCDDCCSKKQEKKSSKGKNGEVNVQNKKAKVEKKKGESYDKGYEKPGFCDCMCLAGVCGGCLGACGCTCSKCCRKKDLYVSGYGLASNTSH